MPENPSIDEIRFDSPDYQRVLGFRDLILRRPLGLSLNAADSAGEESQRHFILRDSDSILAGVIAAHVDPRTIRLRQMWVRDDLAGRGLGRFLIHAVEGILERDGCRVITLHARLTVREFYEKCGYSAEGEIFDEIGLPHIRMNRRIAMSDPPIRELLP